MRKLFKNIYFETRSKCNGTCKFCLGSALYDKRVDRTMSFELYERCLYQLKDLDYRSKVSYHVTNDPLLFPDLDNFILACATMLPYAIPSIWTNGILLSIDRAKRLIDSGIKDITVNYYVDRPAPLPDRFKEIYDLCSRNNVQFKAMIRDRQEILTSRGGTSPNKKATGTTRSNCPYPFTQFNINAVGLVSKCCADVLFRDPMGDVSKEPIIDIWNGPKFEYVRGGLNSLHRENLPNCRDCDFTGDLFFHIGEMLKNPLEEKL